MDAGSRLAILILVVCTAGALGAILYYLRRRKEEADLRADRRSGERRGLDMDRRDNPDRRSRERRKHDEAHNLERRGEERRDSERRAHPDWQESHQELRKKYDREYPGE